MSEIHFSNNSINSIFIYVIGSLITFFLFIIALFTLIILIRNGSNSKMKTHHKSHKVKDYAETETESSCSR